ncbi:MAG TPA: ABC transporter permease [Thermoanaerobaculia bacterium]|nr:ABC transporter permease [Thermoanaerobaculia bacterium]
MRRNPGFTLGISLSLALAIGVNSTVFAGIRSILFERLPLESADRLVVVYQVDPEKDLRRGLASYPQYLDWVRSSRSFDGLAALGARRVNLTGDDRVLPVQAELVSPSYFSVLGVEAAHGRLFSEQGTGDASPVCLLSHRLWRSRFGGDPGALGATLRVGFGVFTVVGVLPEEFGGLHGDADLWVPLELQASLMPENLLQRRGSHWLTVVGRLAGGQTVEGAETEMRSLYRTLAELEGLREPDRTVRIVPLGEDLFGPAMKRSASVLLAAVTAVLLIACANLTSLLLARALARRKEIAVRLAVGATRSRLVRLLLAESVLLGAFGGTASLVVAFWGIELLRVLRPVQVQHLELTIDPGILAYTVALSLATGLVLGLLPALQASKPTLVRELKEA